MALIHGKFECWFNKNGTLSRRFVKDGEEKMNILIIGGAFWSSRKDSDKMSTVVKETLGPNHNYKCISPWWGAVRRALRWLRKTEGPVLMVGKSLGGIRVFELLGKSEFLLEQEHVSVLLVDPHGAGYVRSSEPLPSCNYGVANKGVCIYQTNEYPCGRRWNAQTNVRIKDSSVNHKNIVNQQEVRDVLIELSKS